MKRGRSLSVGSILGDMSIARPSEKGSLFLQTQNRLEIPSQIPSQRSHQDLQVIIVYMGEGFSINDLVSVTIGCARQARIS